MAHRSPALALEADCRSSCGNRCRPATSSLVACPAANGRCTSRGRPAHQRRSTLSTPRDDLVEEARRLDRRRVDDRFAAAKARSRQYERTVSRPPKTVDETIRYRHRHPLVRLAVRVPRAQHAAPPAARRQRAVVVAARSPDPAQRRDPWVCSPRRRWRRRSPTRCSPRRPVSRQTASASTNERQGVGGVIVRLGVVIAIPVRDARRPSRPSPDHRHHRVAGAAVVRARRHRPELLGPRRHPDDRPTDRAGARSPDRRRRCRGDAAQQPRLRAQRAGARRRARRRRRRSRPATRRPRAPTVGGSSTCCR